MRTNSASLFPIGLLALLAALTFWLDHAATSEEGGRSGKLRHDPDYTVDRFQVRRFDSDGALLHSLVADKMLHYPDDDTTHVIAPRLTYHTTPPTRLAADSASLDKDGKHVKLAGNVRIVRDALGTRLQTRIATSVLHVEPDAGLARTDAPVTLTQGRSVINGVGLEANDKTQIAVMRGPVRGTIYPKQAPLAPPNLDPAQ